jgi:hypothetical protein
MDPGHAKSGRVLRHPGGIWYGAGRAPRGLEDIANVRHRAGVMARGRWLPGSMIEERLERIADLLGNE